MYSNIVPFQQDNWVFTRQLQQCIDNLVVDSPNPNRRTVKDHANDLINDITSKMKTLSGRRTELVANNPVEWNNM